MSLELVQSAAMIGRSARVLDVTADEYHADPCAEPSLSSSIAKILADKSPAHAYHAHPRLGGGTHTPSPAQSLGTVLHRLVLGKGATVAVLDFPDYRTKAAREARDAATAAGHTPILAEEAGEMVATAKIIGERLADLGVQLTGQSEVAVEWREPVFMTDGATVQCRAMFDHVFMDSGLIFDLKKTVSAHPGDLAKTITSYGYDIQHAAYTSAMRALRPELAGRETFTFLFCEIEPPFAVTPVRLTGEFRELGERRWQRAVRTWHECTTRGRWPAYADGVVEVSPTPWALAQGM